MRGLEVGIQLCQSEKELEQEPERGVHMCRTHNELEQEPERGVHLCQNHKEREREPTEEPGVHVYPAQKGPKAGVHKKISGPAGVHGMALHLQSPVSTWLPISPHRALLSLDLAPQLSILAT